MDAPVSAAIIQAMPPWSTPPDAAEQPLVPVGDQKALEWLAVLSAARFDYRLVHERERWVIYVPAPQSAAARHELALYERECRLARRRRPAEPVSDRRASPVGIAAVWGVGLLVAFYAWCGPYQPDKALFLAAASDADSILAGQWWRPITALTLHEGFVHVAGNALCLLVLGGAVCMAFGGGLGWLLILGSGVAGNLAVAWMVQTEHTSIGASTAAFGAIGILVSQQSVLTFRQWPDWRSLWSRGWIPLGAGVALLAALGTGPESDLAGHLFGFLFGLALALPCSVWGIRWLPAWGQRLLEFVCLLAVFSAWAAAIRQAGIPPV